MPSSNAAWGFESLPASQKCAINYSMDMRGKSELTAAVRENARKEHARRYYADPNKCTHCGDVIQIRDGEKPSAARKKTFCSHACAGAHNNRKYPKRLPEGKCDGCGSPVTKRRKYCGKNCAVKGSVRRTKAEAKAAGVKAVVYWRQRIKAKSVELKGGKCLICGYSKCSRSLQFHHLDPTKKDFTLSRVTLAWSKIEKELRKCVLVCANCHGEIHDGMIKLSPGGRTAPQADL